MKSTLSEFDFKSILEREPLQKIQIFNIIKTVIASGQKACGFYEYKGAGKSFYEKLFRN